MRVLFEARKFEEGSKFSEKRFVVEDERFSYSSRPVDRTERLDGYVYPGFIDAHAHLVGTGFKATTPSLEKIDSIGKIVDIANSSDTVVLRGWDDELIGRYPSKTELDRVDHPVIAVRRCGHVGVANQRFLGMTGVRSSDGILREKELSKALDLPPDFERLQKAVHAAQREFFSHGVTSIHSDDVIGIPYETITELIAGLDLGVYEHVHVRTFGDTEKILALNPESVKILTDGSLGGRTAYLREPYDDSEGRGILNFSDDELKEMIGLSDSKGVQVVAHAIGDGALDLLLDAFEGTNPDLRHRVVHVQIADVDQIGRMKRLNLCADVQPQFFLSDKNMAKERLGDRIEKAYPFKKLIDTGIPTAFSSDSPVELPDPLAGIRAAKELGINAEESLRAYTREGAYQEFRENEKGGFEDGMIADFIVLSRPISDGETKVVATYKKGRKVWDACT